MGLAPTGKRRLCTAHTQKRTSAVSGSKAARLVKQWVQPIGCRPLTSGADMRGREFISLLGVAAAVWRAQAWA